MTLIAMIFTWLAANHIDDDSTMHIIQGGFVLDCILGALINNQ